MTSVIPSSFVISLSFWNDRTIKERKKNNGVPSFDRHFYHSMVILSSQNDAQMTKMRVKWDIFKTKGKPLSNSLICEILILMSFYHSYIILSSWSHSVVLMLFYHSNIISSSWSHSIVLMSFYHSEVILSRGRGIKLSIIQSHSIFKFDW